MSAGDEDQDKQFEATEKKLQDARKKGEIARSTDLNTAAAYAGFLLAGFAAAPAALNGFGEVAQVFLARPDRLANYLFEGDPRGPGGALLWGMFRGLFLLVGIAALCALLSILAQRSFVVAPEKLKPKLSRISPLSNAKNKFGRGGLFEFSKSTFKLLLVTGILTLYLKSRLPEMLMLMGVSSQVGLASFLRMTLEFWAVVVVTLFAIGAVDYMWQFFEHLRKNRMSHQEMKDEVKQSEGDPQAKQQRRQRGMEIAMNQMLADVPGADVVMVNPTHYAVALKWERNNRSAPVCVAKGVDEIAARIRERANEAGVPIFSDPPAARAIHAAVDLGQEIQPEHYEAAAAAIRFADKMRVKAQAR